MIDSRLVAKVLLISLCGFLLFAQIFHTLHYPIWFDDAFFANVAKNLVNGEGYSAVFFDQSYPFHFGISSGPLVILPAAFFMLFFGNQYWVGDVSNIVLIWFLLGLIFILADDFVGRERKWPWALLALTLSLLFSVNNYGNSNPDRLVVWHLLMGEIPAALSLIIAVLLIFSPKNSRLRIFFGGSFLGLSLLAKSLSAIAVGVILICYFAKIVCQNQCSRKEQISKILLVGFAAILPPLIFEISKIITLGWPQYISLKQDTLKFYSSNALAFSEEQSGRLNIPSSVGNRIAFLKRYIDPCETIFLPISFYILFAAFRTKKPESINCLRAGFTLFLGFFVHLYWWIYFSSGCDRYLVIAFICYCFGIIFLVSAIDYSKQLRIQTGLIILFIALLVVSRQEEVTYLFSKGFVGADEKKQEQFAMVDAIKDLQEQGVRIISCGNNAELEYLLPKSRNFRKCEEVLKNSVEEKTVLVNYFLNSEVEYLRVIRIESDQHYGSTEIIPKKFLAKCSKQYLQGKDFSLNWCSN